MKGYQIIVILDGKLNWHWESCSEQLADKMLAGARSRWRSLIDEGRVVIYTHVIYL